MGFAIYVLLILLGICLPKSRLIAIMILIFMWVIYGFNTLSGDSIAYEYVYELNLQDHFEPAFTYLMSTCRRIGLPFTGFRIILATVFVMLTYAAIRNFTNAAAFALALFMVFPFPAFVSQLRAGLASAIVMYACKYLLTDVKMNAFKYTVGVIIAIMFHYSSAFYFVFLIVKYSRLNKEIFASKLFWGIMTCAMGLSLIFLYGNSIISIISGFFVDARRLEWFYILKKIEGRPNTVGLITMILVLMGTVFVAILSNKTIKKYKNTWTMIPYARNSEVFLKIGIVLLISIPFLILNSTFHRLVYESLLIFICSATNAVMSRRVLTKSIEEILLNSNRLIDYISEIMRAGTNITSVRGKRTARLGWLSIHMNKFIAVAWIVLFALFENYAYIGTYASMMRLFSNNLIFH